MPELRESVTLSQARRIALGAQGLTSVRPDAAAAPGLRQVTAAVQRLGVVQVDAVNVLARAHLMPLFSRLGPYDVGLFDRLHSQAPRRMVEAWAHEASFIPVEIWPLLAWRRRPSHDALRAGATDGLWHVPAQALDQHPEIVEHVREVLESGGPMTAKEMHTALVASDRSSDTAQATGWGNWSAAKAVLEHMFKAGQVLPAGRTPQFERRFDLTERVLPAAVLATPVPDDDAAIRRLMEISARAHGIATPRDLRDYFRLNRGEAKQLADQAIVDLVDNGTLIPVTVHGDRRRNAGRSAVGHDRDGQDAALEATGGSPGPWFLHRDARIPRTADRQALLSPFDPVVFERTRLKTLFDVDYRIEIYTPAHQRVHGYYVLPFLDGDRITARVDLKADRPTGTLLVQASHAEPSVPDADYPGVAERLAAELRLLADWLTLDAITVVPQGNLAPALARAAT